jgi:hypothetical protein
MPPRHLAVDGSRHTDVAPGSGQHHCAVLVRGLWRAGRSTGAFVASARSNRGPAHSGFVVRITKFLLFPWSRDNETLIRE